MRQLPIVALLLLTTLPAYAQFGSFGISTAITDELVLVSKPMGDGPGKIFVFERDDEGVWQHAGEITASDASDEDYFGYFIQAQGAHVFVGAPSMEPGQGGIYVLGRDTESGDWVEVAKITGEDQDQIGAATAISADRIVSGSLQGSDHLTVFERTGDSWSRTATVEAEGAGVDSGFGTGLAMDAERLYVGAPGANEGMGAVHVYALADFSLETTLHSTDSSIVGLGVSLLSMGSGTLFAGAPGLRPNMAQGPPPPGGAVLFKMDGDGNWAEHAKMAGTAGDAFDLYGFSMGTDGSHVYISAFLAGQFSGHVYEFAENDAGEWEASDTLSAEGAQGFGQAMAVSGELFVSTAGASNEGLGAAYIFRKTDGTWTLEGSVDSGEEPPEPETAGIEMIASEEPSECADSLAWQFGCSNVDLLAFLPISDVGGEEGVTASDIWGWTDPETGGEYALLTRSDGTAFINISDPGNPVYLGSLAMTEGAQANVWRDVKVFSNHAFIVADNAGAHGMQVFDLTQLRSVEDAPVVFEETAHYDGIHSAHNIVINEDAGFAYAVGSSGGGEVCGGGLHMIDINDPVNPVFAGCFAHDGTGRSGTGYSHDAQCVIYHGPDSEHADKEICLGSNETALSIADVTDKANPVVIGSADYPNVGYAHQGWLTDDHRYFYMNDELDELQEKVEGTRTLIWDLADLDDPVLVTEYMSGNKSSDHNLYILGDVMYQANYKSGLRIFDISDRSNPTVVGFFDTYPAGEDDAGFAGSWSNYPYFSSGVIIVSSMGEGLFVLKRQSVDI